jgi:hypothetical protein
MTERDSLFRLQALEFRTRGEEASGGVLRLGAPWLRWSYRLLLILAAAGILAASLVRTSESTSGPAVVDASQRTFSALLPAASAPALSRAQVARLEVGDRRPMTVTVRHAAPAAAAAIRRAGLPQPQQPAILLSGSVEPLAAGGRSATGRPLRRRARMVVVLSSTRIGELALRQLKAMLGGGRSS